MSGVGTGYDLSASTYSPDGRIYQVEYALKVSRAAKQSSEVFLFSFSFVFLQATENSGTALAIRVRDGVVFAVEKLGVSRLTVEGSSRRLLQVGRQHGMAVAGLSADCRQLAIRARQEASQWLSSYATVIPTRVLADRVASFMHQHTLYGVLRPFGSSVLIGGWDPTSGYQLFALDASGACTGYKGVAIGKAASAARNEIEKMDLANMTAREAAVAAAKAIYRVHDEVKDKDFELELSWVCDASQQQHQLVPADVFEDASRQARAALQEDYND